MIKAHEIKLYPTQAQEQFFRKSCGTARFAYNWALNRWNEKYLAKEKTSAYSLIKELNSIKKKELTWMLEVGKTCPQYAIHNAEAAYKNFFRMIKDGKIEKQKKAYIKKRKRLGVELNKGKLASIGRPKFKKKGKCEDKFVAVENYLSYKQKDYKLWIPRLGWVKCAENLRFEGKVNSVTVKRIADMWFAVINIDVPCSIPSTISENQALVVGVDRGIKHLAVTSDGKYAENPKALVHRLKSLKCQQRKLSRKVKSSKNRVKQQMKVARVHYKIGCIRKHAIHQATNDIVNNSDVIVMEDLNVKGMMQNETLARSISDAGWGEFMRQIKYKTEWQGKKIIIADRFFASSKTCSCCGWKNENLTLSDRTFVCLSCGFIIDRDLNAAINLKNYGMLHLNKTFPELSGINACREGSSVLPVMTKFSPSVKQEIVSFNNKLTI